MRESFQILYDRVSFLGTDLEEKDIDLRDILHEIITLLDKALPKEAEFD